MRHRPTVPHATLPLLVLALASAACGRSDEIDEQARARVAALGDSAAMSLVQALGGELNRQLASAGPAGAIQFCAGEAQELTDSVARSLGEDWELKRTTRQTRNPRNAPDSLEAVALTHFHQSETEGEGEGPESFVQRTADGDYRYYTPLRMGDMCLECHGEAGSLDPAVRQVLETRYPADSATGYSEGDLRGVIRVTIPASAVR